jgi:sec-independent protein translocase protein TatC
MSYEDLNTALIVIRKKLILLVFVLIFGFIFSFPFTGKVINRINTDILPEGASVIYLSPVEVMLLKFKMSLITGILITTALAAYYVFSAVKKRTDISIYISWFSIGFVGLIIIILFVLGAGYAYYLMLPFFIGYLFNNAASIGVVATYSIAEFISFIVLTTVIFGLVFEFPLLVIILIRSGIVDKNTLKQYRNHVYIGLLVLSALITPPDVFSQIIIAGPLILFFEISLLLARFIRTTK